MANHRLTPTRKARFFLDHCVSVERTAQITGLHEAYVRKIKQRDADKDASHSAWRGNNPQAVAQYRRQQNQNRKAARAARSRGVSSLGL